MKLTNRLQTIAELIEKDAVVGDIGSDHGYLMAYLAEKKIIQKGIASDINAGPVKNCEETINHNGHKNVVDVRLGGGFVPYQPKEIDTAVIAGMGGELIRDIFLESPKVVKSIKQFILQPMTGQDVLRAWLVNNQFKIVSERIAVEQDRFYEILVVEHGSEEVTRPHYMTHIKTDDLVYEIGYKMITDEAYIGFIDKKIMKYTEIKEKIAKHAAKDHPKLKLAESNIDMLNEVKRCILTQKK